MLTGSAESSSTAAGTHGVVKVSRANIRKAPHKQSPRIFSLQRQNRVQVLKERDGWFYIVSDEGQCGWILSSLVQIVKPPAIEPEIKVFSDNLTPGQKPFINGLMVRMRAALAAAEPRQFEFLISRITGTAKGNGPVVVGSRSVVKSNPWLLVLRFPFSRKIYQQEHAPELEPGTVDLLLYHKWLQALLDTQALMVAEIKKNPGNWSVTTPAAAAVKILLILKSKNGDQVALSGFLENGSSIFNDAMILEIHGFSPFSIKASIPANVTDFNQFDLPAPYLPNGNRSSAALAHDFFGFPY